MMLSEASVKKLFNEISELKSEIKALSQLSTWPRWLPTRMASRYSGLSARKLRELYKEGEIYACNLGGGKLLFDKESIDNFLLQDKARLQQHLDLLKRSGLCISGKK